MDSFPALSPATAQPEHIAADDPTPSFSGNGTHPPYSDMIIAAIASLKDKDGSSRQAIAKYIEKEYSNLPPTHPNLLTHHLKRMKNEGPLMMVKHSYMLPHPISVPFQPPPPIMDQHFSDYSVTGSDSFKHDNSSVTPRRKPGRPPKPRQDFGYQVPEIQTHLGQDDHGSEPPIFASLGLADDVTNPPPPPENVVGSAKRGRGRPSKGARTNTSGGGGGGGDGDVEEGRLEPKLMSISVGRPKRTRRPMREPQTVSECGSVSRGRGRPPRNKFKNLTSRSFGGQPSKVGVGKTVIVRDPEQLVAYQKLKLKYEDLQSKAKEVVGAVRPFINPDYEAFGALQELETLLRNNAPSPSYV